MKSSLSITEQTHPSNIKIDKLKVEDSFDFMLDDQKLALKAIKNSKTEIIEVIKSLVFWLKKYNHGRLIYCGAGTSGRIGVQDGVELTPTFGWASSRIDFIIAGGEKALTKSIENAEDSELEAKKLFLEKEVSNHDIVIGLAASGNTVFTETILKKAREVGALTVGISNNPFGKILNHSVHKIILNTKGEVISGSTRLKAGTSQKICLNIISTMVMVSLGRVCDGLMTHMIATNKKLKKRKILIDNLMNKK